VQLYPGEAWLAVVRIAADVAAFLVTVLIIAAVGTLVRKVVGQRLLKPMEYLLKRIPVIREIYDGVSKFLQMLFGDKAGFQRVVAVKFPSERSWTIGFVTNARPWAIPGTEKTSLLTVFIPTAPVPTQGFLILYEQDDIVPLEMTVDEALKLILSGGTLDSREGREGTRNKEQG
jgi:uncharacterized membrane protein